MSQDLNIITPDVKLGNNVVIHNFVNLYGCEIGDETRIGALTDCYNCVKIWKSR